MRRLHAVGMATVIAGAAAFAGCGPVKDSQGSPSLADVLATATPALERSPAPAPTPAPSTIDTDPGATAPPAAVQEDEGLLAVLPEAVEGTPITLEHQGFLDAANDPAFAEGIGSAVFFVAPGTSDIVSGLVARPLDGVYSEAWYTDWRETYDEGACAQAGGVGGHAEAQLAGRPVAITTCAGGMRVYHAWVKSQGVVVSLISLGEDRWGEKVMASLRA